MNRVPGNFCAAMSVLTLLCVTPAAALTLEPLSSFGSGDGWLAPAEATYLQGAGLQRGMTYNSANNHVYLVDRTGANFVHVLDGDTGALLNSLDTTGIAGGTFLLNMVDVADDGAIYAANLAIGANFKVYRWANEAAAPTVAYDGATGFNRTGDTFAVRGAGAATQIIASGSGADDFARLQTVDGLNFTGGAVGSTGGDFRLGLDFIDDNNVIGKAADSNIYDVGVGGGAANANIVNFQGERPLAYYTPDNLLATVTALSPSGNSDVRLYDASDLSALTTTGLLDIANITTADVSNGNGTGDLKFGKGPAGDLRLYALSTNNGIQAFRVVPEPTSIGLSVLALAGVPTLVRRRRG